MSTAVQEIAAMLSKLKSAERRELRGLLDEADYALWRKQTAKFRRLMKGKAKDRRAASQVVSEMRR